MSLQSGTLVGGNLPHESFVDELEFGVGGTNGDGQVFKQSTMPFSGIFCSYLRNTAYAGTVLQVRFGRQGKSQMGNWTTFTEGMSVAFSGGAYSDIIEVRRRVDGLYPGNPNINSYNGFIVAIFAIVLSGTQGAGAGL
jgi:hypothetical protein